MFYTELYFTVLVWSIGLSVAAVVVLWPVFAIIGGIASLFPQRRVTLSPEELDDIRCGRPYVSPQHREWQKREAARIAEIEAWRAEVGLTTAGRQARAR